MKPALSLVSDKHPELNHKIPFSNESEANVLGSVFSENSLMNRLYFLAPDDFYHAINRDIFNAMRRCSAEGKNITPISVAPLVEDVGDFEAVGGLHSYLVKLIGISCRVIYPLDYARHVHDLAQRRRLIETADVLTCALMRENDDLSPAQHITKLRAQLEEIEKGEQLDMFVDNVTVTERIIKALSKGAVCYPTGLNLLDGAMDGGLYGGKVYGFGARKKVGKTALAATISANLSMQGTPHCYIACEMGADEIQQRTLSRMTDTFPSAFRNGYGKSDDFYHRLANAQSKLSKNMWFVDAPSMTFEMLRHVVPQAIERKKLKGFILDYWQLVGGKAKGQSTAEFLDEVAQWIAGYTKRTGCFAIVMAQLNQDDNTRGSEGLRLACDQFYAIVRKNLGEPHSSLEMLETRYTEWTNINDLWLNSKGPFFEHKDL